ncbi:hypothetical protein CAPTEDRAFT_211817, partial [Capitella teleta]
MLVVAVCPTGKYKGVGDPVINDEPNCENECHCTELQCVYINGTCIDGCGIGWKGDVCNERDCEVENGGCQHQCTEDKRDEWCSCDEGIDISPNDWKKCLDINECLGESDCHECINTIGSYTCRCDHGYELHPNGTSCGDVDECERGMYDVDRCHTCVNLIGGHTCLCNETFVLDKSNNNETCIGIAVVVLLLLAAAFAVVCFVKRRRKQEKNPKQSEVPTNTSFKISDVNVPDVEILEENEYEEIRDSSIEPLPSAAATKQTPDVTYYNTSGKHPTTLDNSTSDGNSA